MFLAKNVAVILIWIGMAGAQAAEDTAKFSIEVMRQVAEAEQAASTESPNTYRKRLVKLRSVLREKEAQYLKSGIEESEAQEASGDLELLEAFEWVELKKLKAPRDCEAAHKALRSIEDPQSVGEGLQNPAHQVLARLIRPLCEPRRKK